MNGDTIILAAFCVFIVLLGVRMKQRYAEWKKNQVQLDPEVARKESKIRYWFTIIQLVVLGALMVYMTPSLMKDFTGAGSGNFVNVVLRCLIFICTIYIFIWGVRRLLSRRNKENREE